MLSIIIPVYNVEQYIERCVQSILNQSYSEWEIILIDDGSEDQSGVLCDKIAEKDNRIAVFHQDNQGASVARNRGLELARGEYIYFMDADDWIDQEMFENMMQGDPVDMVVCGYKRIFGFGSNTIKKIDLWTDKKEKIFDTENVYYDILCKSGTLWNKIIKRVSIGDVRFQKEHSYGEDMLFLAHIMQNVKTARIIRQFYYNYFYDRPGNVVSAELNSKYFDYLNNAVSVYCLTEQQGCASCGVYRIHVAVWDVLKKVTGGTYANQKEYIDASFEALRYPKIKDQLLYLFDRRVWNYKFRIRLLCLMIKIWVLRCGGER